MGLRHIIQDMIAPDLKAHTAKLDMLQKQAEIQHASLIKTIDAFRTEMRPGLQRSEANKHLEVFVWYRR